MSEYILHTVVGLDLLHCGEVGVSTVGQVNYTYALSVLSPPRLCCSICGSWCWVLLCTVTRVSLSMVGQVAAAVALYIVAATVMLFYLWFWCWVLLCTVTRVGLSMVGQVAAAVALFLL